jgi:non-ribosomal peptide synthetase component F
MILSHASGNEDIVYGQLVAGRNAIVAGIERIVGPCINIIPVRGRVSPQYTSAQLMNSIQEQYACLEEADSLGLNDIIRHCTNWPAGSQFDSVILHQNIDEHPEIRLGDFTTRLQSFANPHRVPSQLFMMSSLKDGQLRIMVTANSHIMTREAVKALANGVCKMITRLAADLDAPVVALLNE